MSRAATDWKNRLFSGGWSVYFNIYEPLAADGPDPLKLENRWLRTEGGFILQLSAAELGGKLVTGYFNPKSMHVAFERTL